MQIVDINRTSYFIRFNITESNLYSTETLATTVFPHLGDPIQTFRYQDIIPNNHLTNRNTDDRIMSCFML